MDNSSDSEGQRKLEDSGEGLLPVVEGHSLEQKKKPTRSGSMVHVQKFLQYGSPLSSW